MTYVVGIGGTTRSGSSSERALAHALEGARRAGATTEMLGARDLDFPMYEPGRTDRSEKARRFVDAVSRADGVIIASPGYHGGISGLIKNALDYIEDLREDDPSYLDGRAVGCIVVAYGWQATVTTLVALRSVVHALRGWPTPLGVAVNAAEAVFDSDGAVVHAPTAAQLDLLGRQVVEFAEMRRAREQVASR